MTTQQYRVQWAYRSSYGGPWQAGEHVLLDPVLAEAVNRDSPGVLQLVQDPADSIAKEPVKADRLHRGGRKRG